MVMRRNSYYLKKIRKHCNGITDIMNKASFNKNDLTALREWFLKNAGVCETILERAAAAVKKGSEVKK